LVAAVCAYWAAVTVILAVTINKNQGHLVYGLDDAYIHMAIAKNAAIHHVWGVTRFGFTSSTSSPLWTFLLAGAYLVFGVNEWSPLVLNLLFGTLTLVCAYVFLAKHINRAAHWLIFLVLLTAVTVTPMPWMTVIGMEQLLHALLTLCFVFIAAEQLSSSKRETPRGRILLLVLAPLLSMTRYEGLFVVLVVCVLLLTRKRALYSAGIGVVALAPVVAYGFWSVSHGWFFLPNSLLLKGHRPDASSLSGIASLLGLRALTGIWHNPHLMVLLGAALLQLIYLRFKRRNALDPGRAYASLAFVGAILLHVQFASSGWGYRYESYLVVLGVVTVSTSLSDLLFAIRAWNLGRRALLRYAPGIPLLMVLAALFHSVAYRSVIAPQAMTNIFEQQFQMGLFLRRFYPGRTVAVNDIGAVCYLADVRLLDLFGLGTVETARSKLRGQYSTRVISDLAQERQVDVAIVYDRWLRHYSGGIPAEWIRIGQWKIQHNLVCGDNSISLYATTPSAADELTRNLKAFAADLPPDVGQFGTYVEE